MAFPYGYRIAPVGLGVGADNAALIRPHPAPASGSYSPAYNVRRAVAVAAPAYVKERQDLPDIDLRGNGTYLSGVLALQALSDFESGAS